jgi:hypothetical protein
MGQHQVDMILIHRHSPSENERSRVRSVKAVAVEHRGDVDRRQGVPVDHVVDLGAELARNFEQAAFELLVDLRFGTGLRRRKRLLGVLNGPA